jgi:hypothetical protein
VCPSLVAAGLVLADRISNVGGSFQALDARDKPAHED